MKKYLLTAMLASASLAFGQPEGGTATDLI